MKAISNQDLARLLAANHSHADIARMLGVTQSAITQAAAAEDVKFLQEQIAASSDAQQFDDRYDSLESKALGLLEQKLAFEGHGMKLRELSQTVQLLNGLKRRANAQYNPAQVQATVQLTLPVQIINQVVVSPQQEIVEVNGRRMSTVQPKQLLQLAQEKKNEPKQLIADLL